MFKISQKSIIKSKKTILTKLIKKFLKNLFTNNKNSSLGHYFGFLGHLFVDKTSHYFVKIH